MTIKEYQERAMSTCMDSCNNIAYMAFNLVGEVGEFSSKIAKWIRKQKYYFEDNELRICGDMVSPEEQKRIFKMSEEEQHKWAREQIDKAMKDHEVNMVELKKELGDIMWQAFGIASVLDWEMEEVLQMNLDKLASRKERNVIDGEGDNR